MKFRVAPKNETQAIGVFATTRWSIVRGAGMASDAGELALQELCRLYWFPVYALVRARGVHAEQAKDVTQDFFAKLIERRMVEKACPERGRFRHFLGTAVKHFLTDEWHKAQAIKRGGGIEFVALDDDEAERRWVATSSASTPDEAFDRNWALQILAEANRRVEQEMVETGQEEILRVLQQGADPHAPSLAEESARLGMGINTLKSRLHRARARHAQIIREVVAETVSTPAEVESELRELLAIVSRD